MFHLLPKLIKWVSIPVLLSASTFSFLAGSYSFALNLMVCLGAAIAIERALHYGQPFWAAGFLAVGIVFSPLFLLGKIFFLMALACCAVLIALLAAFRRQRQPVV